VPPGDLGLADALAGQAQRGIAMLEPAARAADADARVRQNLALAYALAGDWRNAQAIAAQDISPAELGARMRQWASFAQPAASWDQVAHLLGVTPVADQGQPVRLALAPARPADTAMAAVEPDPAPVPQNVAQAAPILLASAEPDSPAPPSEWGRDPQPSKSEEVTEPVYAQAVEALVAPRAPVVRASVDSVSAPVIQFQPRQRFTTPRSGGRYVVQLGAFGSSQAVERAWAKAYRLYGFASRTPLSTTIRVAGRGTFHRLSVSGFDSRSGADSACRSVRAKGGSCFVRAVAGDSPVRWASRYIDRPA
jgi:hypothetical protein